MPCVALCGRFLPLGGVVWASTTWSGSGDASKNNLQAASFLLRAPSSASQGPPCQRRDAFVFLMMPRRGGVGTQAVVSPGGANDAVQHVAIAVPAAPELERSNAQAPSATGAADMASSRGDIELGSAAASRGEETGVSTVYVSTTSNTAAAGGAVLQPARQGSIGSKQPPSSGAAAGTQKADLEAAAEEKHDICRICLFETREADEEARGIVVADLGENDVLVPLRCGCKARILVSTPAEKKRQ